MPEQDQNNEKPIIDPKDEASEKDFMAALKAAQEAAKSAIDEATPTGVSNLIALDSLQGNEFHVELNGQIVMGVFRVDGLTSYVLADEGPATPPIVLAKMVQRDASLPFNQWLRETVENQGAAARPTRTLEIVAVDDGEETRRWSLHGAYITRIEYNTFDTSSSDLIEETLTIAYKTLKEQWTWSDKL
jgi:hypothetical protein